MTARQTLEKDCEVRRGWAKKSRWRISGSLWVAFTFLLICIGGLTRYGFTIGNAAAVNGSQIQEVKSDQQEIKREVKEKLDRIDERVYDIWKSNGGSHP